MEVGLRNLSRLVPKLFVGTFWVGRLNAFGRRLKNVGGGSLNNARTFRIPHARKEPDYLYR